MRKYFFFLILFFFFYQCNENPSTEMKTMSFLALGDSYTIGESVLPLERFPNILYQKMNQEGILLSEPRIIAKTGWTTDELAGAIAQSNLNDSVFSMVSLLIGVNNQYRGRDTANYRIEFTDLLEKAISFAANKADRVIVLSIPDWGVTPFAANRDTLLIAAQIDAFNLINREISKKYGVYYVDITDISRLAKMQANLIAADGLHPSPLMYQMWVDKIYYFAKKILKNE